MMTNQPLVSLIIRTKNEEKWIGHCLRAVNSQDYKNTEIVLVDNESTDQTVAVAKQFNVKVVSISKFKPGAAINLGIKESSGEYLVCLSGHCIPTDNRWLSNLIQDLDNKEVAGVYGRQEPLSFTSDIDKRDLLMVFGLDKKVQIRDSFFHNANSAFRREVWDKYPFDEEVTNIEDRVWGQQVINSGLKIIYQPSASVYHWHGIHHDLNPVRAQKIVKILEKLEGFAPKPIDTTINDMNIVAIIPVKGQSLSIGTRTLLEYTIKAAQESEFISRVVVSTDNQKTASLAVELGAEVPFIRPPALSEAYVDISEVLRYSLQKIEEIYGLQDLVVCLEEVYPFRKPGLIDIMIQRLVQDGLDAIVAAKPEMRGIWLEKEGQLDMYSDGLMPSTLKESRALIAMIGLCYVTHPYCLRSSSKLPDNSGIFEVTDSLSSIQVRDKASEKIAEQLLEAWSHANSPLQPV